MPCDNCGHTLQNINVASENRRIFYCPRCGTLVTETDSRREIDTPKLVERCRKFEETLATDLCPGYLKLWHTRGIREAINKPETR